MVCLLSLSAIITAGHVRRFAAKGKCFVVKKHLVFLTSRERPGNKFCNLNILFVLFYIQVLWKVTCKYYCLVLFSRIFLVQEFEFNGVDLGQLPIILFFIFDANVIREDYLEWNLVWFTSEMCINTKEKWRFFGLKSLQLSTSICWNPHLRTEKGIQLLKCHCCKK